MVIRRVEFFRDNDILDLQKQVNKFLKGLDNSSGDYEVADIKYGHYIEVVIEEEGYVKYRNIIVHTAMVDYVIMDVKKSL